MLETTRKIEAGADVESEKLKTLKQEIADSREFVLSFTKQLLFKSKNEDANTLAQDLTQQTMDRAILYANKYDRTKSKLTTWLNTIAKNIVVDFFRHKQTRCENRVDDSTDPDTLIEEKEIADPILRKNIEAAIADLAPNQQEILKLLYIEHLDYSQISQRLNIKTKTVGTKLHRAKQKLKTILEEKYDIDVSKME